MAAATTTVDPLHAFVGAAGAAASVINSAGEISAASSSSSLLSSVAAQTLPLPQGSSTSSPFSSPPSLSSLSSSLPTSSTLPSLVSTPTSSTKPGSHITHQKIAIAVVIPTVVVTLILFGLWAWRKSNRRNRSAVVDGRHPTTPLQEIQPYLQQKAELEDESRRRHELEARERRHELDGNEIFELRGRHSRQ